MIANSSACSENSFRAIAKPPPANAAGVVIVLSSRSFDPFTSSSIDAAEIKLCHAIGSLSTAAGFDPPRLTR